MTKRMVCLFCCFALALITPFQALAATEFRMAGFDGDSSSHVWKDNAFFTRMQEATGISFTFDEYTDYDQWQTAKKTMFAGNDLSDVLFKAHLSTREQIEYADAGLLIDLKPLLEQNAPNLWALLQAHPDWLKAITLPDGKIVALPEVNELSTQNAMWINRQWLDALKLDAPTDWESLVETLRAFKTGDPNGNGKADEIPLSFLGPWDLKFLAHAAGLVANDYNVYVDGAGVVRLMPEDDRYIAFLGDLAELYAQGLLDESGFYTSDSFRAITDSSATVTYGLYFGPNPMNLMPYDLAAQYDLLEPLASGGARVYRDLDGQVLGGTFAITSACGDPAALLGWVDELYTEQGAILAMAGKEGEDYAFDEKGNWNYAGDLKTNSSYILYSLSVYDTGDMPWLFPLDFYNRYEDESIRRVNQELMKLRPYLVRPFPVYTLTPAQEDEIAPLQSELGRYVDESTARFVIGEWDARSAADVAQYLAGLKARDSDAFLAFWQKIADANAQ